MEPAGELTEIAKRLETAARSGDRYADGLNSVSKAADGVARSFSGHWNWGAPIYFKNFGVPRPGQGYVVGSERSSNTPWAMYENQVVAEFIEKLANFPDIESARIFAYSAVQVFDREKDEAISVLEIELSRGSDPFLYRIKRALETLEQPSDLDRRRRWPEVIADLSLPKQEQAQVPPHVIVNTEINSIKRSFEICDAAAGLCLKAASHLQRKSGTKKSPASSRIGTKVFIGHGRSPAWRELKDFAQDRLGLPWDEFNRVPVAGVTNIARLSEMLDAAAIAFLVLTAEDELAEGDLQPRMNVVHEAGLFQGRLGFTRAIVILEEGTKEFSNIQGLGQIRFPKGRLSAAFEEVRGVLEREEII
jgi:predicted nucleotide-binding protein